MKQRRRYRKLKQEASGEIREVSEGGRWIELPVGMEELIGGTSELVEGVVREVGMQVIGLTLSSEAQRLAGKKHRKDPERKVHWWGSQPGWVYYAGQKVGIERPRLREKGGGEVPLQSYQALQSSQGQQASILRDMVLGISTRNYEELVHRFQEGYGIKKSSVSRHFVKASAQQLREFLERPLGEWDVGVIFIDGLVLSGECLVCAVGIDWQGNKRVLGIWQGATENATICRHLLEDLVRRGVSVEREYLFVLDGSKALRAAVEQVFGKDVTVQRCQQHKRRNVLEHLSGEFQRKVELRLSAAYHKNTYEEARKELTTLVSYVERINPSAARSLQEGLEETLTVHRLKIPESLRKTLVTTNPIESCFSVTRSLLRQVKRFRGGGMLQRWVVTGLLRAEKKFRKIKGYRALPQLQVALDQKTLYKKEVAA